MALLMILFIMLDVFLLITKFRNSYTWMYVTMIMFIEIELIFTLFLYVKLYDYSALYNWERSLHFFVSGIKINYYTIFDVFTYTLAGYMAMSMLVALHEMKKGTAKQIVTILLSIPIVVFALINNHYVNMRFYLKIYMNMSNLHMAMPYLINAYNVIILIAYIVLPFAVLGVNIFKAKITYLKKQLAIRSLYLLAIDFFGAFVFMQYVPHKLVLTYAPNYLRFSSEMHSIKVHTDFMWLVILTVIILLLAILAAKSRMFDKIDIRKQYKHKSPKKTKIPFQDTRSVFHTCKNILLSIDFIGKSMEQKKLTPEVAEDVKAIQDQIKNGLNKLTYILNLYNTQTEIIEDVNLIDCIDNAIIEAKIPPDITITKSYENNSIYISADSMLIEETLINLLKNAVDAISRKGEGNGRIDIRIQTESGWLCMYIRDNGCGIMKKDYKRIFTPLFSTKKTAQNWGVGLSFALGVINSIGGQILFRSKYGKFTEFEILLPLAERSICQIKSEGDKVQWQR